MKKVRIWVIDDEAGMRRAVERSLRGLYQVDTFEDPVMALDSLDPNQPPEIAIVDIRMPKLDGFQVLVGIKERSPSTDVILMTGSMTEPDAHLTRALREKAFYFLRKPFDRDVLRTLVQRCVDLRRLSEENRRHTTRLEKELEEARAFQRQLLPSPSARLDRFSIESHYQPCTELGGDFYDFVQVSPGTVTVLVADASGHGASAAMMNSVVKSSLHAGRTARPLNVIQRIAEGIEPLGDERFITALCARLDANEGTLEYVSAGHPPGLHIRGNQPKEARVGKLTTTGPLLSPILTEGPWETITHPWETGDRLMLYTDGVSEVSGEAGLFGEERIEEVVRGCHKGGRDCIDAIIEEVKRFAAGRPIKDDVTLMVADGLGS